MEITKRKENALLKREEVTGTLKFAGATPRQSELAAALAKKLNTSPDNIFVLHIYTNFGTTTASFEAHVYKSREDLEKTVRLGKKAREKIAKATPKPEEKKAEAPAEAKPEEKKAEVPAQKPAEGEAKA